MFFVNLSPVCFFTGTFSVIIKKKFFIRCDNSLTRYILLFTQWIYLINYYFSFLPLESRVWTLFTGKPHSRILILDDSYVSLLCLNNLTSYFTNTRLRVHLELLLAPMLLVYYRFYNTFTRFFWSPEWFTRAMSRQLFVGQPSCKPPWFLLEHSRTFSKFPEWRFLATV